MSGNPTYKDLTRGIALHILRVFYDKGDFMIEGLIKEGKISLSAIIAPGSNHCVDSFTTKTFDQIILYNLKNCLVRRSARFDGSITASSSFPCVSRPALAS